MSDNYAHNVVLASERERCRILTVRMDQRDRLFADIAARLELLTREQIATCARLAESTQGKRIGDVAIELGFINDKEAQLIRAQEARALERLRPGARGQAPAGAGGARIEERAARSDPRSASSPAAPKVAPPPPPSPVGAKRGTVRAWQAPEQLAQGQIHVPRQSVRPASRRDLPAAAPVMPTHRSAAPAPRNTPPARPAVPSAAPPPPTRDADARRMRSMQASVDVFPLAQGADVARLSVPLEEPAAQGMQRWSDGTLGHSATQPTAEQATAPNKTLMQTFAAPAAPAPAPPPPAPQPVREPAHEMAPATASPDEPPLKAAARRPATAATPAESYLGKALALAIRHGASDLHAHSGAPLIMRVDGQLRPLANDTPLSAEAAERIIADITTDEQWAQLAKKGEVDFACEIAGLARFRVNVYRQHRGIDAVFRIIPLKPPTLSELGLPERLSRLTDFRTGMVLCTGPAGCGKSSTLAALLGSLVQSRSEHILTIENPVEFVLPGGKSLVNQRQVIDHTTRFRARCAQRCAKTQTSSRLPSCAIERRCRSRSAPRKPATSCSARYTPAARRRRSSASLAPSLQTSRSKYARWSPSRFARWSASAWCPWRAARGARPHSSY